MRREGNLQVQPAPKVGVVGPWKEWRVKTVRDWPLVTLNLSVKELFVGSVYLLLVVAGLSRLLLCGFREANKELGTAIGDLQCRLY